MIPFLYQFPIPDNLRSRNLGSSGVGVDPALIVSAGARVLKRTLSFAALSLPSDYRNVVERGLLSHRNKSFSHLNNLWREQRGKEVGRGSFDTTTATGCQFNRLINSLKNHLRFPIRVSWQSVCVSQEVSAYACWGTTQIFWLYQHSCQLFICQPYTGKSPKMGSLDMSLNQIGISSGLSSDLLTY